MLKFIVDLLNYFDFDSIFAYIYNHIAYFIIFMIQMSSLHYFKGKVDRTNRHLRVYREQEHGRVVSSFFTVYFEHDAEIEKRFKAYVRSFEPRLYDEIFTK